MLNTITTLRMPDGKEVAFVDWSDKPVYSTCELVHGFTREEIDLFGYTVGDNIPTAAPTPTGSRPTRSCWSSPASAVRGSSRRMPSPFDCSTASSF